MEFARRPITGHIDGQVTEWAILARKGSSMCECISRVNEGLKPKGLQLATAFIFSKDLSHAGVCLPVAVEKKSKADRKTRVPIILAPYCPFCGERQHHVPELEGELQAADAKG